MGNNNNNISKYIIIFILSIILVQIVSNPKLSISSASEGLNLWFNLLVPSLFPFILISDLLVSFGFIDLFSKYLEPIMRPVFNVSGIGILPFSMSIMSGYPVGAKLTSKLRSMNSISKIEGERLICFSSTSGPLFIVGTVLLGMVGATNLSPLMIIPHYLGAITLGILLKFYKKDSEKKLNNYSIGKIPYKKSSNNYSIGFIISKSIKESLDSIAVIGGFVIIYSVVINILLSSNTFNLLINKISMIICIDENILKGLIAGIVEITNGCNIISKLNIDIFHKILLLNSIIAWGGFSIHSQALAFISTTDIKPSIYLISKMFHSILTSLYTYIGYLLFYKDRIVTTFTFPVYSNIKPNINSWLILLASSTKIVLSILVFLILLSITTRELRKYN